MLEYKDLPSTTATTMPGFPFHASMGTQACVYLPPPLARESASAAYNLSRRVQPCALANGAARLSGTYPSPAASEPDRSIQTPLLGVLSPQLPLTPAHEADSWLPAPTPETSIEEACRQVDVLLRQATIDQLTSPLFDSWIFFMQRMHETCTGTKSCVFEKQWWDEMRQLRYEAWLRDLAEMTEESHCLLESVIRRSARMSW